MPSSCPSCGGSTPSGARWCPECGNALGALSSDATRDLLPGLPGSPSKPPSSSSRSEARFAPGRMLDERYRIEGLLGRGGMGEVYRAQDLKLGQTVALKFVPEEVSRDPRWLERFFNEVRTARQVTHPNVCRVHDLGEVDGHHFLSMEYVDGEDLGSLLRRIGRLPQEKAVEIARQLAAGLAAAHEEGILHRDLKPANVMLDGRGRARITDFGLAGLVESIEESDIRSGTPTYQAPEQLAGREVTRASDIYSLGLLLYELFTGHRAFEATSREELLRLEESTTPVSLASRVDGLDDAIERVVQRCLAPDPAARPRSALAVAAALPGGDPLAAALAAGETPSPEMVADAGRSDGLPVATALGLLACILLGIGFTIVVHSRFSLLARAGYPKSFTQLEVEARQMLEALGIDSEVGDTYLGWGSERAVFPWLVERDPDSPWEELPELRPHMYRFLYRQSPEWLEVDGFRPAVGWTHPPSSEPGTVDLHLDAEGRLVELHVIAPSAWIAEEEGDVDWERLFEAAGLERSSLAERAPMLRPRSFCEGRSAWTARYPGQPEIEFWVEGCAVGSRPVFFEVVGPWDERPEARRWQAGVGDRGEEGEGETPGSGAEQEGDPGALLDWFFPLLFLAIVIAGLALVRRNLRLGRADLVGATRLALFSFTAAILHDLLVANHVADTREFPLLFQLASQAIAGGFLVWILYVAVEPFVRRIWPQLIIGWRRLLEGRFTDPLVGRDLLVGGAVIQGLLVGRLFLGYVVSRDRIPGGGSLNVALGAREWLAGLVDVAQSIPVVTLVGLTLVVVLRLFLESRFAIWAGVTALMTLLLTFGSGLGPLSAVGFFLIWGSVMLLLVRFGLLATAAAGLISNQVGVLVFDPSSWFFGSAVLTQAVVLAPFLFAFWTSIGDRRLLSSDLLS